MTKILIADDEALTRMLIRDTLTKNNYEVVGEAVNGIETVEKYKELKPDLVLMDITMPEMDGIQALKAIREFDSDAKIVICSNIGQQQIVVETILAGAKDFIVKPFSEEKVLETIKKAL